jgi:hypothetical protein
VSPAPMQAAATFAAFIDCGPTLGGPCHHPTQSGPACGMALMTPPAATTPPMCAPPTLAGCPQQTLAGCPPTQPPACPPPTLANCAAQTAPQTGSIFCIQPSVNFCPPPSNVQCPPVPQQNFAQTVLTLPPQCFGAPAHAAAFTAPPTFPPGSRIVTGIDSCGSPPTSQAPICGL